MPIWYGRTTGGRLSTVEQPMPEPKEPEAPKLKPENVYYFEEDKKFLQRYCTVDGVRYNSMAAAARAMGWKPKRISQYARKHDVTEFEVEGHEIQILGWSAKTRSKKAVHNKRQRAKNPGEAERRGNPRRVRVDGVLYNSFTEAENAHGFRLGKIGWYKRTHGLTEFYLNDHEVEIVDTDVDERPQTKKKTGAVCACRVDGVMYGSMSDAALAMGWHDQRISQYRRVHGGLDKFIMDGHEVEVLDGVVEGN